MAVTDTTPRPRAPLGELRFNRLLVAYDGSDSADLALSAASPPAPGGLRRGAAGGAGVGPIAPMLGRRQLVVGHRGAPPGAAQHPFQREHVPRVLEVGRTQVDAQERAAEQRARPKSERRQPDGRGERVAPDDAMQAQEVRPPRVALAHRWHAARGCTRTRARRTRAAPRRRASGGGARSRRRAAPPPPPAPRTPGRGTSARAARSRRRAARARAATPRGRGWRWRRDAGRGPGRRAASRGRRRDRRASRG